ncbi:hypothetical protein [Leucobacter sp. Psy1]|uniref:hypothetical protein n=1 Tax=Leucobacter sp. Psy1 TaxID=2875729 RepID=UPI001CD77908|nr:hypothetical protein [Leucobacter sp. Psy1]
MSHPRWVAASDIPLFVLASALAASGLRWPRHVAVTWTVLVAMLARTRALALYAPLRRACRDPR